MVQRSVVMSEFATCAEERGKEASAECSNCSSLLPQAGERGKEAVVSQHDLEECLEQRMKEWPSTATLSKLVELLDSVVVSEEENEENGEVIMTTLNESVGNTLNRRQFSQLTRKIYRLYHSNDVAMTMVGKKCMDEEEYSLAEIFFKVALQANPDCLVAMENQRILYDRMLHRWHFHMLNDFERNSAYKKAIHLAMQDMATPNSHVLDIGSGTGLLSMLAVQAGAERVYAIERNALMADISMEILKLNKMAEKVDVIQSLSTSLSVPQHIPTRAALVVTETVDAGLLGEHIIPTLRHAWKELLLPPRPSPSYVATGCVIPSGATVYATGIQCVEFRKKSKLLSNVVAGVDLGSVQLRGSCTERKDRETMMKQNIKWLEEEICYSESLSHIRGGVVSLTPTKPILQFDFTNPEIPLPESHCSLVVTCGGQLDAIAVWFDLHLYKDINLCTAPSCGLCWDQALFPTPELTLKEGETIVLHSTASESSLYVEVETASSISSSVPERPDVFYLERSDLLRVNDLMYTSHYYSALREALAVSKREEKGSEEEEEANCDDMANSLMLDISHGFSLFGLAAIKLGADFSLVVQSSLAYQSILKTLAVSNSIEEHVSIHHHDLCHLDPSLVWDVVVCDVVSPQGTLYQGVLEKLAHVKATQFHSTSIIIPFAFTVEVVLVSSPALRARSTVLGSVPTLGLEIAPFVNHYQVTHLVDFDLEAVPVQLLSDIVKVMEVNLHSSSLQKLRQSHQVTVTQDGNIMGVAYWFNLHLFGDVTINTAPRHYEGSHWHQCVFMLTEDLPVVKGDVMEVGGVIQDSCLQLSCVKIS